DCANAGRTPPARTAKRISAPSAHRVRVVDRMTDMMPRGPKADSPLQQGGRGGEPPWHAECPMTPHVDARIAAPSGVRLPRMLPLFPDVLHLCPRARLHDARHRRAGERAVSARRHRELV